MGNPGPVLQLINEWYENAAKAFGVNPVEVKYVKEYLIQAGFTEVKEKIIQVPIGEWHKDQGNSLPFMTLVFINTFFFLVEKENGFLLKQVFKAFYDSKRSWWVSELKLPGPEYDRLTTAALNEIDNEQSYIDYVIFTARKPL